MVITVGIILLLRKAGHLAVEKIDQSHRTRAWAWLFFLSHAGGLAFKPTSQSLPAFLGVLTAHQTWLVSLPQACYP
jgi:hypothetical protein